MRVGNNTASSAGEHEFWNIDMGVSMSDKSERLKAPCGWRMSRFHLRCQWSGFGSIGEIDAVHYYAGSLLEEDPRRCPCSVVSMRSSRRSARVAHRPLPSIARHKWRDDAATLRHAAQLYAQVHGSKEF